MARKEVKASTSGEIPTWFMTYSDVITLLMTFFILLLTFASDQPETFEQMKESMFGGKGSVGIAGDNLDSLDRESVVVRMRPRNGRLTTRGSETPSSFNDPAIESVDRGLKTLEEQSDLAKFERMTFETSYSSFVTDDGKLTSIAQQHLRLLAIQMRKLPLDVTFEVGREQDLSGIIDMCDLMTNALRIPTGRISAGIADGPAAPKHGLRITVVRTM